MEKSRSETCAERSGIGGAHKNPAKDGVFHGICFILQTGQPGVERSAGGVLLNFGERLSFDEFERSSLDDAGDGTALQALRADAHGLMRAIFRGDTNITKVRFENTARDAGHFRTNTAEILGATASLNHITDLLSLTAKATNCHCTSSLSFMFRFGVSQQPVHHIST